MRVLAFVFALFLTFEALASQRVAVVRDSDGKVVNVVSLPDNWSGSPGQWQLPNGHSAVDAATRGQPNDTWDGNQFITPAPVKPTVISYESFNDRFTEAEFDAATNFVYETDANKPKRPKLLQAFNRAVSRGTIDLLDPKTEAFLDALVAGGVVTESRKDEILAP